MKRCEIMATASGALAALLVVLLLGDPARAADEISAGTVEVQPGGAVVVDVTADSDIAEVGLSISLSIDDESFCTCTDVALCGITPVGDRYTQDGGGIEVCAAQSQGSLTAGSGTILRWKFTLAGDAAEGSYPIRVSVNDSRFATSDGLLVVVGPTLTPTASPTPTATPIPPATNDDDGCAVVAPPSGGVAWVLLLPLVALIARCRRHR